jgi:D-ribose pyranose/furanose isomerase RbsD
MLKTGILNPHLNSLLSRVRHTNALVIADRGFPFWLGIEIVDLSLVDGIPTVLQVLAAIRTNFVIGQAFVAEEFFSNNAESTNPHSPMPSRASRSRANPTWSLKKGAQRHRFDPNGGHDALRQPDPRFCLV